MTFSERSLEVSATALIPPFTTFWSPLNPLNIFSRRWTSAKQVKQRFASPRLRLSPSKTKGLLVTDQARWLPSCEPFYVDVKRYAHAAFKKGCYRSRRNNHTNKALSVVRAFSMVTHTKWKAMWFYRTTAKMRTTTTTTTKGLSTTLSIPGL